MKQKQRLSSKKLSAIILSVILLGVVVCFFIPFQDNPFYYARIERQTKQRLQKDMTTQFTSANEYLQSVGVVFAGPSEVKCPDGPFSGTSPCTIVRETAPKELPVSAVLINRWLQNMPAVDAKLKQEGWNYYDSSATSASGIVAVQNIFGPTVQQIVSVGYTKQNAETHNDYCAIFIEYSNTQAKTLRVSELCNN